MSFKLCYTISIQRGNYLMDATKAERIYDLAMAGGDVNALADEIVKTNDQYFTYLFAKNVKNAPINKLAQAIIDSDYAYYIFLFACNVKNAPIDKLTDAIIASESEHYIAMFAKSVENAPMDKLKAALKRLRENNEPENE